MNFIKRNIKIFIVIILIIILSTIIGIKYYLNNNKNNINTNTEKEIKIEKKINKKEEESKKDKIYVDIKGAIKKPGVYELDNDKKVIDAVYLAGGLSEEADTTYVNLAKKLTDEMVIIIYTKDQIKKIKTTELISTESSGSCVCPKIENDACINKKDNSTSKSSNSNKNSSNKSSSSSKNTTTKTDEPVNINTATKEELQTISGIGEGKAQAIIDYREEFGNFNTIEDILNVSGIGESVYEKIKDHITV